MDTTVLSKAPQIISSQEEVTQALNEKAGKKAEGDQDTKELNQMTPKRSKGKIVVTFVCFCLIERKTSGQKDNEENEVLAKFAPVPATLEPISGCGVYALLGKTVEKSYFIFSLTAKSSISKRCCFSLQQHNNKENNNDKF